MSTSDLVARIDETAAAIRASVDLAPRIGVVLGSGLGGFGERLRKVVKVRYADLPHMPAPTMPGHAGTFCLGFVDDVPVICMEGRVHVYEGHPVWRVVHGVRVMARLGVRAALLTNAAGAIDPAWTVGTMMAVTDHVDLMAHEPLDRVADGPSPFPDMRDAYDPALRDELHTAAHVESQLSARISQNPTTIELEEGVYAAMRDPSCETPAFVRMLATLGANVVGASTVPEVTALRQLGVRVAALSYVSHHAAGIGDGPLEEETTSRFGLSHLHRVVRAWVLHADRLQL